MKRFIYEIHYTDVDYSQHDEYTTDYLVAENFRAAKSEIKRLYAKEIKEGIAEIDMIAEIKFERYA